MKIDNKGFSMVEILLSVVIGLIVIGAVVGAYTGAVKIFKDVKSISSTIDTKTPSLELVARFFDRWGVGVVSQQRIRTDGTIEDVEPTCTNCPAFDKVLSITDGTPCDTVQFFGNLYGFGFVQSVGTAANLVSCRLRNDISSQQCYTVWRNNFPENTITSGSVTPIQLTGLTPHNADCSGLASGTTSNATATATLTGVTLQAGDVIHRSAHQITLSCGPNSEDGNRNWLRATLGDTTACGDNESATPVAPVESFDVQALPAGCTPANGDCRALSVTIVFRSQSAKHTGQFDTYSVTKVFGR